jgi:hypothetical protein
MAKEASPTYSIVKQGSGCARGRLRRRDARYRLNVGAFALFAKKTSKWCRG